MEQVPISWIEHYAYCPRQWGLIALEAVFDDNELTARGHIVHRVADLPGGVTRPGVRIERALPLWSSRLGLHGKADVVEFRSGVPFPVEYKAGSRAERPAILQLAAQAVCLEEMFDVEVGAGAIYLAAKRDRVVVELTSEIRRDVEATVREIRVALAASRVGIPADDARCGRCSLRQRCVPHLAHNRRRVSALVPGTYRP